MLLVLFFSAAILLSFAGIFSRDLSLPDEPRVAEIGLEMAKGNSWVIPTLNGRSFLEKPPLYFWVMALIFKAAGKHSDGLARLPSALFGLGTILIVFLTGKRFFGSMAGILSGFVLATSLLFLRITHKCISDPSLLFFSSVCAYLFLVAFASSPGRRKTFLYSCFFIAWGFIFLCKGLVGWALLGPVIVFFILLEKKPKEFIRMNPLFGILLCAGVILPWAIAIAKEGGRPALEEFFIAQNFGRFIGKGEKAGHVRPFWFYVFPDLLKFFLPWTPLGIAALIRWLREPKPVWHANRRAERFSILWFITGFTALSISAGKRDLYLLPLVPGPALFIGSYLSRRIQEKATRFERAMTWIFSVSISLFILGALVYTGVESEKIFDPVIVVAFLVSLFLAIFTFKKLKKAGPTYWLVQALHLWLGILIIFEVTYPLVKSKRYLSPFAREVKRCVDPETRLYVYPHDEALLGAIPFYTGIRPEEVENLSDLKNRMAQGEAFFLALRRRRARSNKDILLLDKLNLLVSYPIGEDQKCLLYEFNPGSAGEAGE